MYDIIRIRRGMSTSIPQLNDGELGFCKSNGRLYIGTEDGNVEITSKNVATIITDGLMSKADKKKLNNIAENANNYTLPTATAEILGGIKVGDGFNIIEGILSIGDVDCGTF